jgi:hypothetical protein
VEGALGLLVIDPAARRVFRPAIKLLGAAEGATADNN